MRVWDRNDGTSHDYRDEGLRRPRGPDFKLFLTTFVKSAILYNSCFILLYTKTCSKIKKAQIITMIEGKGLVRGEIISMGGGGMIVLISPGVFEKPS